MVLLRYNALRKGLHSIQVAKVIFMDLEAVEDCTRRVAGRCFADTPVSHTPAMVLLRRLPTSRYLTRHVAPLLFAADTEVIELDLLGYSEFGQSMDMDLGGKIQADRVAQALRTAESSSCFFWGEEDVREALTALTGCGKT